MIPVAIEKIKAKHVLAILAGAAIALANEIIDIPLLVTLKIIKILSM